MTNRVLVINLSSSSGTVQLDEDLDYKKIVLKSFSYRASSAPTDTFYIRFNGIGGNIVSNINIYGIPLHINSNNSVWTPNIPIALTRRLPQTLSFDIVNEDNTLFNFTGTTKFELVFSLEK